MRSFSKIRYSAGDSVRRRARRSLISDASAGIWLISSKRRLPEP
jgi:hypothetical protein